MKCIVYIVVLMGTVAVQGMAWRRYHWHVMDHDGPDHHGPHRFHHGPPHRFHHEHHHQNFQQTHCNHTTRTEGYRRRCINATSTVSPKVTETTSIPTTIPSFISTPTNSPRITHRPTEIRTDEIATTQSPSIKSHPTEIRPGVTLTALYSSTKNDLAENQTVQMATTLSSSTKKHHVEIQPDTTTLYSSQTTEAPPLRFTPRPVRKAPSTPEPTTMTLPQITTWRPKSPPAILAEITAAPETTLSLDEGPPTLSPDIIRCMESCPATPEFNPVCGTNRVMYENEGRLFCAKSCGIDVSILRRSLCPPPVFDDPFEGGPPAGRLPGEEPPEGGPPEGGPPGGGLPGQEQPSGGSPVGGPSEGEPPGDGPPGRGLTGQGPPEGRPPGREASGQASPEGGPPGRGPPGQGPPGREPSGQESPEGGPPGSEPSGQGSPEGRPPGRGQPGSEPLGQGPPVGGSAEASFSPPPSPPPTLPAFLTRTTPLSKFHSCMRQCPITADFTPVCGTDLITYMNMERLLCAQKCGDGVQVLCKRPCAVCGVNPVTTIKPRATTSVSTTTPTTTSNPSSRQKEEAAIRLCMRSCPVTPEYNPICGSDRLTYTNPGHLLCAQTCGVDVTVTRFSPCHVTSTSTTTTEFPLTYDELNCIRDCRVTAVYNPVCGTDNLTYINLGHLECARYCGLDVALKESSRCRGDLDYPTERTEKTQAPTSPTIHREMDKIISSTQTTTTITTTPQPTTTNTPVPTSSTTFGFTIPLDILKGIFDTTTNNPVPFTTPSSTTTTTTTERPTKEVDEDVDLDARFGKDIKDKDYDSRIIFPED